MIHWKISQKLGELYVKEPGLPVENAVLLFFETAKLTGDSRTSDQAELMEKLISVSENLTEKGMHHKIGWYDQKKEHMHRTIRNSHLDIFSILPQKIREIWQISLHGSAVSRPYGQEKMSVSC